MAKQFDIKKFNNILKEHNQQLYAEKITTEEILLSNGLSLIFERDIRLCKKRVMNGSKVWKENFDNVYSLNKDQREISEKKCRALTSVNGGKSCQEKHGEKIKSNLNKSPWNKGLKGNYPYSFARSAETKLKISKANTGENNGMFGKIMSLTEKEYRSKLMKEKILSGEFTPNSNNRNTHWESFYKGKKYRSSWEALYQHLDNDAEYETLRLKYHLGNQSHIYIVDFVNHKTKTLIEVKPKELLNDIKTEKKILAAKQWCIENNYKLIIADKAYFLSHDMPTNFNNFDINTQNKIKNLYEAY
jgi:hypothetical protein